MGDNFYREQSFHITPGKEYTVLGLQLEVGARLWGVGAYVQIASDYGGISFAPLELFEITDARASRFWEAHLWEGGAVTLWPAAFYRAYFHDDLSEQEPSAVAAYNLAKATIESEYS